MHPSRFVSHLPHALELGVFVEAFDAETKLCTLRLPFRPDLIGDPERGFLHGGVMTTLLDTLGAAAVLAQDLPLQATLDLRIDYLRPALAGADLIAFARCHRVTRHVAFVRGTCHQGDPTRAVAELTATFVLADPEGRVTEFKA